MALTKSHSKPDLMRLPRQPSARQCNFIEGAGMEALGSATCDGDTQDLSSIKCLASGGGSFLAVWPEQAGRHRSIFRQEEQHTGSNTSPQTTTNTKLAGPS